MINSQIKVYIYIYIYIFLNAFDFRSLSSLFPHFPGIQIAITKIKNYTLNSKIKTHKNKIEKKIS